MPIVKAKMSLYGCQSNIVDYTFIHYGDLWAMPCLCIGGVLKFFSRIINLFNHVFKESDKRTTEIICWCYYEIA